MRYYCAMRENNEYLEMVWMSVWDGDDGVFIIKTKSIQNFKDAFIFLPHFLCTCAHTHTKKKGRTRRRRRLLLHLFIFNETIFLVNFNYTITFYNKLAKRNWNSTAKIDCCCLFTSFSFHQSLIFVSLLCVCVCIFSIFFFSLLLLYVNNSIFGDNP